MNPHRPRKPRHEGAALHYLQQWREYVEITETIARRGGYVPWVSGCPCCDPLFGNDSRRRLESLMHNGGRRARRLRVAVARLDERFRGVTIEEQGEWEAKPWWERRRPRDP